MDFNCYLYRGVNIEMHNRNEGFIPKGLTFSRISRHGESYITHGNGISHGNSKTNSIIAHQIDSSRFPCTGISTTPIFEIAKKYATYNNKKGVVYKIDMLKFEKYRIEYFVVKDWISFPYKPEDMEVIIRHKLDKEIDLNIVEKIYDV